MGVTGGRFVSAPVTGPTAHFYRQVVRLSSAFAFTADLVLLVLGGAFKFREKISGRLADILSHLYMCSAVLKRFEDDGRPEADLPLVKWALRDSLFVIPKPAHQRAEKLPHPMAWESYQTDRISIGSPLSRTL